MQEQTRIVRGEIQTPVIEGFNDGSGAAVAAMANEATVTHGPYAESLPVAGMTVAEVRRRFQDRLDINPQATPFLDGTAADEETVIQAGQLLMFVRRSGEKGAVAWKP